MQRCSKKAFAMCPTRHLCGCIEDATFTDDSECAAFNKAVEERPRTNADRIRDMSDEELCTLLMAEPPCDLIRMDLSKHCIENDCESCIKEWLQQPEEEKCYAE